VKGYHYRRSQALNDLGATDHNDEPPTMAESDKWRGGITSGEREPLMMINDTKPPATGILTIMTSPQR
jgi:hypothetical protein